MCGNHQKAESKDYVSESCNSTYNSEFSAEACGSYDWDGVTYTESGDYVRPYTTVQGCDSIVTGYLNLSKADITEILKESM